MSVTVATKISESDKKSLAARAESAGMSVSSYLAKLINDDLVGAQRIDLQIQNIMEEVLQIQSMLGLMQGFNSQVFSTILGRTERDNLSAEEKRIAVEKKRRSAAYLKSVLASVTADIVNGENVWGETENDSTPDD